MNLGKKNGIIYNIEYEFSFSRRSVMLLEFVFNNCYSYKDEAYFSMEAVKKTRKNNEFASFNGHRILKSAIIFGPNASGKSNLMKSLRTFQNLVLKDDKLKNPFPTYANNPDSINFEITILIEETIYKYSVSYCSDEIIEEHLEIEEGYEFVTYFHRIKGNYEVIPRELELLKNKTRMDSLFLITGKTFNDYHCLNVFRWFRNNLIFISREVPHVFNHLYKLQKDKKRKKKLINFLQAADFNIVDFEVLQSNVTMPDEIKQLFISTADFTKFQTKIKHRDHDGETFDLSVSQESDGTKKMIALSTILLTLNNSTIFIDEFDDSFHLGLSKALVDVFNSNENSNQVILTSHELELMDAGFKKEQIYFTDRSADGATELYSVYDFKSEVNRQDYSYVKRYNKGLFGAVPEILVGKLKEIIKGD